MSPKILIVTIVIALCQLAAAQVPDADILGYQLPLDLSAIPWVEPPPLVHAAAGDLILSGASSSVSDILRDMLASVLSRRRAEPQLTPPNVRDKPWTAREVVVPPMPGNQGDCTAELKRQCSMPDNQGASPCKRCREVGVPIGPDGGLDERAKPPESKEPRSPPPPQ
jgi:hypothetical protein